MGRALFVIHRYPHAEKRRKRETKQRRRLPPLAMLATRRNTISRNEARLYDCPFTCSLTVFHNSSKTQQRLQLPEALDHSRRRQRAPLAHRENAHECRRGISNARITCNHLSLQHHVRRGAKTFSYCQPVTHQRSDRNQSSQNTVVPKLCHGVCAVQQVRRQRAHDNLIIRRQRARRVDQCARETGSCRRQ